MGFTSEGNDGIGGAPLRPGGRSAEYASHMVGLDDFAVQAAAEAVVESRQTRRLNATVEGSSSTLVGVLVTLAELRVTVHLTTANGWACTGQLTAVSEHAAVLLTNRGTTSGRGVTAGRGTTAGFGTAANRPPQRVVIALDALVSVTPLAGELVSGDQEGQMSLSVAGFLSDLVGLGEPVTVILRTASTVTGIPLWSGADTVCIDTSRHASLRGAPVYVSIAHVEAVITT
jgi:small nuclear ribonucleoprotein (snRNP)-like protein